MEWLRQQFGMTPFFEPHDDNPYLEDFYQDMDRWAFNSQLWFLIRRFQIHREIDQRAAQHTTPLVQDRTIYEDAEIFAAHLHSTGRISERDWASYRDLYRTLRQELRPPDLLIYLRCPLKTLTKRIRKRGRAFEKKVPRRYLGALERLYEDWIVRYQASPKLVVETDRLELRGAPVRPFGANSCHREPRWAPLGRPRWLKVQRTSQELRDRCVQCGQAFGRLSQVNIRCGAHGALAPRDCALAPRMKNSHSIDASRWK